jgi:hypothetical protein
MSLNLEKNALSEVEQKKLKTLIWLHLFFMQTIISFLFIPMIVIQKEEINPQNTDQMQDLGMILQIGAFLVNLVIILVYRAQSKKLLKIKPSELLPKFFQLHVFTWAGFELCAVLGLAYALILKDPKGSQLFVMLSFLSIVAHPATKAKYNALKNGD